MGLRVGCRVQVVGGGAGGGPVVVAVGDTRLAVGHGMANKIMVAIETE
jgi:Fe2+ transport system protein FeoA